MKAILLHLLTQTYALPIIHTDSGFSLGAKWWKPDEGINGVKIGGDGFYLTEGFRTHIFEPIVAQIIRTINDLKAEDEAQKRFDIGVTIGFAGFVLTATTIALYSMYSNYCKEK